MGRSTAVVLWSADSCMSALVEVGKAHGYELETVAVLSSTQGFVHSSYGEVVVVQTWQAYLTRPTMA